MPSLRLSEIHKDRVGRVGSRTFPQALQWCRLWKMVKALSHRRQLVEVLSGVQMGAAAGKDKERTRKDRDRGGGEKGKVGQVRTGTAAQACPANHLRSPFPD